MDKRTKFLIIRLRSQEKKKLFEYANSVDTTVSVLIRKLIRVTITKKYPVSAPTQTGYNYITYDETIAMGNKYNISLRLIQLQPQIFKVRLQLPTQTRFIGAINFTGEGVYYKKIKLSIHEFHKSQSIGFCFNLLNNYKFKWIKVFTDNGMLETSRRFVLQHGIIKQFHKKNLEKQIFLEINLFGCDRAERWENNNSIQQDLFQEVEQ